MPQRNKLNVEFYLPKKISFYFLDPIKREFKAIILEKYICFDIGIGVNNIPNSTNNTNKNTSLNSTSENNHADDIESHFAPSIDMMPSFEDTLDHTDDELLDLPSGPRVTQASRESSE